MELLGTPTDAATWCQARRAEGLTIGLVPTMGALHEGHLRLVERAARENDRCVASLFVNPLQFNDKSDYEAYPRDTENDAAMLGASGCDMAFTGSIADFFPGHDDPATIERLDPGPFAQGLEGAQRPGHFAGVRTIVERLFLTCRPDRAYFGQKDFQQTLVVKDLARTMGFPRIVVCPTVRENNGLAMSSRNRRLDETQREQAAVIYRALLAARDAWRNGERTRGALAAVMQDVLAGGALTVEYAAIRDPEHWQAHDPSDRLDRAQALIAARAGSVRLIDNLRLDD